MRTRLTCPFTSRCAGYRAYKKSGTLYLQHKSTAPSLNESTSSDIHGNLCLDRKNQYQNQRIILDQISETLNYRRRQENKRTDTYFVKNWMTSACSGFGSSHDSGEIVKNIQCKTSGNFRIHCHWILLGAGLNIYRMRIFLIVTQNQSLQTFFLPLLVTSKFSQILI